jgi:uncharacterized protein YjiS (DUF1127 family)
MAHTIETKPGGALGAAKQASGAFAKVRRVFAKTLYKLVIWQERAEQRQALGELNDRMLKDIGVSVSDAYREARKPFWLP